MQFGTLFQKCLCMYYLQSYATVADIVFSALKEILMELYQRVNKVQITSQIALFGTFFFLRLLAPFIVIPSKQLLKGKILTEIIFNFGLANQLFQQIKN